jgi:mono/diheme cytochrome c family protein
MRDLATIGVIGAALGCLCGCSYTHYKGEQGAIVPPTGAGTAAPQVTFAQLNQDIIQPKCISCHSSGSSSGVDLSSYAGVAAQVVAGNPAQSTLYLQVESGQMPKGGPALSESELADVYNWIAQGAQNN